MVMESGIAPKAGLRAVSQEVANEASDSFVVVVKLLRRYGVEVNSFMRDYCLGVLERRRWRHQAELHTWLDERMF